MNTKNYISELMLGDKIGFGASGNVYTCQFNYNQHAYKEITMDDEYKAFIQPRLEKISEFYGDPNFIFPYKFIYKEPSDSLFNGYIMDYISDYSKLCDLKINHAEKINILLKARELLDKFHKEYKHVHTDINPWNFMYNQENNKIILFDFDTCIDLSKKNEINNSQLNYLAKIYCKYNGYDTHLDIFMFNLLTFSILNNVNFYDVIGDIIDGDYGCIESTRAIDILKDYRDIEVNTLKKEYVIDYL